MFKVLVVYDEYNELIAIESTLKKVGIDVMGLGTEFSFKEKMISFNPDAVLVHGKGYKFTTTSIGKKLKEMTRWKGKSILIFLPHQDPQSEDLLNMRMDLMLQSPVSSVKILQVIAILFGKEEDILVKRYDRAIELENSRAEEALKKKNQSKVDSGATISVKGKASPLDEAVNRALNTAPFAGDEDSVFRNSQKKEKLSSLSEDADPADRLDELVRQEVSFNENLAKEEFQETKDNVQDLNSDFSKIHQELERHQQLLSSKMPKYAQQISSIQIDQPQRLTRVEARRAQRGLVSEWDAQALADQDLHRQAFVKALFSS